MADDNARITPDRQSGLPALQFGIFDWIDEGRPLDLADIYEQRLRMLEYADSAGFWGYHLAEHHGTPLCMAPSPSLFLASAAQRTRRIRLGPLVHLLPLYNPLRLVEEICMLDHLTRGRLELGVGRGVSPFELALFNVDIGESRDIFREALEIVLGGLATGKVSHRGRYFSFADAEVPLRPFQRPYPPLWYPTSNPDSVPWIAEQGFNTLLGFTTPSLADTVELVGRYKQLLVEKRDAPNRLNAHVANPRFGFARHVYVAQTDAQALREAKAAYADFFYNFNYLWARHASDRFAHWSEFEAFVDQGLIFVGSPSTVRAQLKEYADAIGGNYFAGVFAFGSLTTEQVLSSLYLFSREVLPAFSAPTAAGASRPV